MVTLGLTLNWIRNYGLIKINYVDLRYISVESFLLINIVGYRPICGSDAMGPTRGHGGLSGKNESLSHDR